MIRVVISSTQPIYFDPYDSQYYFDYELFQAFRLQVITFIFSTLENHRLIILFQTILSSFAWLYFLYVTQKFFSIKVIKLIYQIAIIFFSFSQIVLLRDSHILSESLTLATSLILCTLVLGFDKSRASHHIGFTLALLFFSGIKSTNSVIGLLIFIIYIVYHIFIDKKVFKKRSFLIPLILSAPIMLNFFHSSISSNITAQLNTSAIINFRIWGNNDWKEYLLDQKFPPELRTIWRDRQEYNLGETPDQGVINEVIYQNWWSSNGNRFLITFMTKNPDYTLIGPIFLPLLNPKTDYSHTLIHGWAQDPRSNFKIIDYELPTDVLWPKERLESYILIFLMLSLISIYILMTPLLGYPAPNLSVNKIIGILIFIILWSYFSWWFGSKPGGDILRHQEMPSVLIRLVFLICLFKILEWLFFRLKNVDFLKFPR